jgi:hypothetical protein
MMPVTGGQRVSCFESSDIRSERLELRAYDAGDAGPAGGR